MSKELKAAIDANDPKRAREAAKSITDWKRKLPNAGPPLTYACKIGADAVIEVLLKAGAPMPQGGYEGNHPFAIAAENGHVKVLKKLAARGVPPEVAEHVLFSAIIDRREEVAHAVLESCQPKITQMMVYFATQSKKGRLLDALVKGGADVNVPNDGKHNRELKGITAMHQAASRGDVAAVKMLAQHGADVNAVDACNRTPLIHLAAEARFDKRFGDDGEYLEAALRLLKLRVQANAKDRFGNDALMHHQWTCLCDKTKVNKKFASLLSRAGASGGGKTWELFVAVCDDNTAAAKRAISKGADVNHISPPPAAVTPLVWANSPEMVDLLVAAGADPNKR